MGFSLLLMGVLLRAPAPGQAPTNDSSGSNLERRLYPYEPQIPSRLGSRRRSIAAADELKIPALLEERKPGKSAGKLGRASSGRRESHLYFHRKDSRIVKK